jgi:putative spermidine/putrescine transport system permease protein
MNTIALLDSRKSITANFIRSIIALCRRLKPLLLLLPFALLFFLFQIAPMLWIVVNSFVVDDAYSVENYQQVFDSAFLLQSFVSSLWLAFWSSLISLVIALFFVSSLRHIQSWMRDWVISFTNMTANFSGVPLAFAFIIILGFNGALTLILKQWGWIDDFNLYGQWGVLVIYVYFQVPLATLLLYPAFDAISDDWQDASALLGAKKWQFWTQVGLPVLAPAILGTFVILMANAIGAYASVYALTTGNYNVVTVRIASLVSGDLFLEPNLAAAISVLLMIILAFITLINQCLISRSYHAKN